MHLRVRSGSPKLRLVSQVPRLPPPSTFLTSLDIETTSKDIVDAERAINVLHDRDPPVVMMSMTLARTKLRNLDRTAK